jgi:hypothetical protein
MRQNTPTWLYLSYFTLKLISLLASNRMCHMRFSSWRCCLRSTNYQRTQWSRVLLEKVTVAQISFQFVQLRLSRISQVECWKLSTFQQTFNLPSSGWIWLGVFVRLVQGDSILDVQILVVSSTQKKIVHINMGPQTLSFQVRVLLTC